jgi:NitT/TauT family transport system substrate-binding protein
MSQPRDTIERSWIVVLLLCAASIVFPAFAMTAEKAGDKPLEKVRVAYSAISGSQVIAWVAHELGFFRKNGLDVELIFIEGGPRAVQSLVSGEVAFAQVAGAPVIQRNLRGASAVMIAGFLNTLDYQFIVAKDITRPDQLKGKAVAVSQPGSASDFATRYALEKYGLEPGKDVTILEIGSQPARFAALETGKIQGVMIAVPLTLKARKMGFNVLADLQMLGLEFQYSGIATTQELIKSRPDLMRNFTKACVEAIHYFKTHRKESLEILRKYMKTDDMEALAETYEVIGLTLIPEKPYPTVRGFQMMLQELAAKDPKAQAAKPEQFVNMSFVRELESSGYIDRLYKTAPVVAARKETGAGATAPAVVEKGKTASEKAKPGLESKPTAGTKEKVASAKRPSTGGAEGKSYEYTVKAGDTLSHLALRYYGKAMEWQRIYEANRETLKNPHYIYIGQKIIVPDSDGSIVA